jgi:hypothetical protein
MKLEQREFTFKAGDFAMQGKIAIELKGVSAHPVSVLVMNSDGLMINDAEVLSAPPYVVIKLQNAFKGSTKELVFKPKYERYKVIVTLPNIIEN